MAAPIYTSCVTIQAADQLYPAGGGALTGCGKTESGGRRRFRPPHNVSTDKGGFSPGHMGSAIFMRNPDFFRRLFNPLIFNLHCFAAFRIGCYQ